MQPRYEEDCDRCKFLGSYNEFDLYICGQVNFVARYGKGPYYHSGKSFTFSEPGLNMALRLADEQGLIGDEFRELIIKIQEKFLFHYELDSRYKKSIDEDYKNTGIEMYTIQGVEYWDLLSKK